MLKTFNIFVEGLLFIEIGLSIVKYADKLVSDFGFILVLFGIVFLTRLITTSVLAIGLNLLNWKGNMHVSVTNGYDYVTLLCGGLFKGAVPYAMSMLIEDPYYDANGKLTPGGRIKYSVFVSILLTTFVWTPIFNLVCIVCEKHNPKIHSKLDHDKEKKEKKPGCFKRLDENKLRPFLITDYKELCKSGKY